MQFQKPHSKLDYTTIRVATCDTAMVPRAPGVQVIPAGQRRINIQVEELVPDPKTMFTDGVSVGLHPLPMPEED